MKTKVIAFRVTQEEYDALSFNAQFHKMPLGKFVNICLSYEIEKALVGWSKEQKRLEAKAKRDAKKAAANGAQ